MGRPTLTLFYDCVSPWSWIHFEVLLRYEAIWAVDLILEPFFLGGVNHNTGNVPPFLNPYKRQYGAQIMSVARKMYEMKLKEPAYFPANTIKAMRLLRVIKTRYTRDVLIECSRECWKCYWDEGRNPEKDGDLVLHLGRVLGESVVEKMLSEDITAKVKKELADVTELAVEKGSFGAPWTVATLEDGGYQGFFGSDSMERLAFYLGKEYLGPFPARELAQRQRDQSKL
ncbi:hypothetical protein SeLEV6574_g06254 [Synchytrium endobioticum]|nr:hypothetical protein SeLEV6574_g06254 [Synchytrium endobioticum]